MKLYRSILLILLLGSGSVTAQERLLERANRQYADYSFKPAQDIYQKVVDRGYVSAELLQRLGNSYYFNAQYDRAAESYERLLREFEDEATPDYYFRYAQALRSTGQLGRADSVMERFTELTRSLSDARAEIYQANRDYQAEIQANSGRYDLTPFAFNSPYSDFAPSLTGEGLLFSSDRDTGNLARYRHTWNSQDFLDLYEVSPDSARGQRVTKVDGVNSRFHESTSALSPDGNTLYFTRNNFKEGKYSRDEAGFVRLKIFRAEKIDGVWATIEELPFNSDSYSVAHPALSPDGRVLYFASDMPGSRIGAADQVAQSDLWRVVIREDGTFGEPENLGPKINTEARETFPFVSSEGILYFSSDGHPGLGGLDVFATKLDYLPWKGSVQNVGTPVNSAQDDFTYVISDTTREGYFASNRPGGPGGDDIYGFVENRPLQFECIQAISGTVRNKITNELLAGATVRIIDEQNNEVSSAITDSRGNYEITLDCNQPNFVRASREGYVPAEEYLSPSDGKPRVVDFYLEPETITAGYGDDLAKLLQLSTIYFDFDKANIRPDAEIEIQKVIAAMEKYPSLRIKANSHTDSRGPDAYNLALSQRRADSTVRYMISKGIAPERLEGEGFGESRLINRCDDGVPCSAQEHELNRRSEFIILE
ncbi:MULTISPECIES: OmpA family protein [unclassified Robiginitalea]|uniref:OmpA family protein n=1 Tax=Robiginitalea TaxID=252306 RepID=UPI00234B6E15|nr:MULTISPECIES: OmpA family protein [unclassified Robiginitalea]MDC6354738.1 OmpA family protein [Robiginitalea sp. PM2]MDC6374580.1 OmpA family protein [Robiginitalea sp. SP8]